MASRRKSVTVKARTTSTPRTVTTGQELEALIQANPRAVLELPDGNLCRAERFRSLGEWLWEDELPATVLSPAPSAAHDAQVAAQALRDAARYARPDGGDHVGMTRSEAEAFEDALTLVEEYADRIEAQGVEG